MHNSIYQTQSFYFRKLLDYHKIEVLPSVHAAQSNTFYVKQYKIAGFTEYNYLIDINQIFSTLPSGDIVDRTQTVQLPFKMYPGRPWTNPTSNPYTLDQCIQSRVNFLTSNYSKVNIFWSGGIDSTTAVVGFLKHCQDFSKFRIIYTTMSMKENPGFFLKMNTIPDLEMIEFGGDVYLEQNLDGVFVSGDGADDLTASLDLSFYEKVGHDRLNDNWYDLFEEYNPNIDFLDFCQKYFGQSHLPIRTVLEARWWFYVMCKMQKWVSRNSLILKETQPLSIDFFDFYEFETFMYHNLDKIVVGNDYKGYKQILKDYIHNFNQDRKYLLEKEKVGSGQIGVYSKKKLYLQSAHYIMMLDNGTRIRTDNLPLLSELEYRRKFGDSLNYLFVP
jgi:hypothetical protein